MRWISTFPPTATENGRSDLYLLLESSDERCRIDGSVTTSLGERGSLGLIIGFPPHYSLVSSWHEDRTEDAVVEEVKKMAGSPSVKAAPFTYASHALAVASAAMVLVWCVHFRGGLTFESSNKSLIFNVRYPSSHVLVTSSHVGNSFYNQFFPFFFCSSVAVSAHLFILEINRSRRVFC